jgi:His-Xaa-Ser system radical SAM maturase HxsB
MSKFQEISFYSQKKDQGYKLLPFKFSELDSERYLLTNIAGEFIILEKPLLESFIQHRLEVNDDAYINLRSKQFLLDEHNQIAPDLLALKLRTRYASLADFTALHIFVVSLRCEHSCPYCQVSRQSEDKLTFDMTQAIADKSLELVFKSPSPMIKIEFQGGEPLLNFEIVKYIVLKATQMNLQERKDLDFVIATNLALIDSNILEFCKEYGVHISTSLDGPENLHNQNRPRPGKNSYQKTIEGIQLSREILGKHSVSALMTTTEASLGRVKEIIDEYISVEFNGIFLRHLSPYGFAIKTKTYLAYSTERWLEFYKEGLEYIIDLNRRGVDFREYHACTVLTKMLSSNNPGFVDLMSPSGIGIAAVVYNYDGTVHASDESRMLAEMGDKTFMLGNVLENSYEEIFGSDALLNPIEESFSLSAPMCSDCAYEPYCGSDPVYHHGIHKDFLARKPNSDFCHRNMSIFKYLLLRMDGDPFVRKLFIDWANHR